VLSRIEGLFFHRPSTSNVSLDALDGMRGIAVLFVVLSHLSLFDLDPIPGLSFRGAGEYGVFLFFVLSAFLLTWQQLGRSDAELHRLRPWLVYAARRVLRIFPLYAVVLLVGWGLGDLDAREVARHLALREGQGVYWTIPVEFKYYLVLPVVVFAFALALGRRTLPVVAGVAIALPLVAWLWPPPPPGEAVVWLGPYLPVFLLGSLTAFVHWKLSAQAFAPTGLLRLALPLVAIAALASVLVLVPDAWLRLTAREVEPARFQANFVLLGALWSLFLLGTLQGGRGLARALAWKPLRLVGIVSFSIYLWHLQVILIAWHGVGSRGLKSAAALVGTLGVACISYLVFERPFLRLGLRARDALRAQG
jgi:peptidoglycan/LPS O-acetylase OafA/YrhL